MSYDGINLDDWSRWDLIGGGIGERITKVAHSSLANPLTNHGDNCIQFQTTIVDKSACFHTYEDPRNAHRFNGNTDQSIWAVWRNHMDYGHSAINPNIDIGLRYSGGQSGTLYSYWLVVGYKGMFITTTNSTPGYCRLTPWSGTNPDTNNGVKYAHVFAPDTWHAIKLRVEPSGADDQILHAYLGSDIDNPDSFGEVTWTEVMTMKHTLVGADEVTLGTKIADFQGGPRVWGGKPNFVVNGAYAGYGAYYFGRIYIDSIGVKLN